MKIDEWAVQDAVSSGDLARLLPIIVDHYGVGKLPDWASLEQEHSIDCTICAIIRPWLSHHLAINET